MVTIVEQGLVGLRMFGGQDVLDVLDEDASEIRRALEAIVNW